MRKQAYYRLRKGSKLAALLMGLSDRHGLHDVFHDFVELAAYAVSNKFDRLQFDKREAAYMRVIKKYTREQANVFGHALAELSHEYILGGPDDVLGKLAGDMEVLNKHFGQHFTPYHLSQMLAKMTMSDTKEIIERSGFIRGLEPACGAGGMVIAMAGALGSQNIDYSKTLHVSAVDIDPRCVRMTYLQCSLLGIPAVITHGNSLTGEYDEDWFTPAHILGGWTRRINVRREVETHSAWWDTSLVEERVLFLQQHHLDLAHALRTVPHPSVAAVKEAEMPTTSPLLFDIALCNPPFGR